MSTAENARRFTMKLQRLTSCKGITLIELLVTISLSSILFLALMGTFEGVVHGTDIQTMQSDMQEQFMSAYRLLEKDIRMSGYNLPGNGLVPLLNSNGKTSLVMLRNDADKSARLSVAANAGDSKLLVDNGMGVMINQWVCLAKDSSFSYYQVGRVSLHSGEGFDTVELADSTISTTWAQNTKVYFANEVKYSIDSLNGKWCLVRHSIINDCIVGPSIDSVSFTPQDSMSADVGNDFSKAHYVGITLASHFKRATQNPLTVNSFDVKLRNYL
jgi:prepilin-type N-terminal cleavage/methylation domain-containing protein